MKFLVGLSRRPIHRRLSSLRIKNSLTTEGAETSLLKVEGKTFTWYSCGPTVYEVHQSAFHVLAALQLLKFYISQAAHLGHARSYVCTDIIRRLLMDYFGFQINFAMGITDIDDKIFAKATAAGLSTWPEIESMVRRLEDEFFEDLDLLGVRRPDAVLRVSEHMPDIVQYVAHLENSGHTYTTAHGVNFDISTVVGGYGKLGGVAVDEGPAEHTDAGGFVSTAVGSDEKRDRRDFALWKLTKPGEPISWPSPWGPGRPGWHIECSALTNAFFGPRVDMHSGGIDLKFPHHTNEIAQW